MTIFILCEDLVRVTVQLQKILFIPLEMCWHVMSASPQLLSSSLTDTKFIICLINGCHMWFFYFREEKVKEGKIKEGKKCLKGRLCRQNQAGCKALPMDRDYVCFLKGKRHNQVFGLTSSFYQ